MNILNRKISGLGVAGVLLMSCNAVFADSTLRYDAILSAAQEVPAVESSASGRIVIAFEDDLSELRLILRVRDLGGNFVGAHFHCAPAGSNGPVVFGLVNPGPLTFDGKDVSGELTNADYTGADCTATTGRTINNVASLEAAMDAGLIYVNVHTTVVPSGEIRGQIRGGAH